MPANLSRRPLALALEAALPIVPNSPGVADMHKAFAPIDQLLASLDQGEVDIEGATPVMRDWDGWCEIAPAVQGWCDCWERIARRMGETVPDLAFLRRIANRLAAGMLLDTADIDRAHAVIARCRALYFACPVWIRKSAVQDEMIAIALDDLGLRRAA
ncbi:hypothetical protein [Dechloromonas denitrificans]|uniref:hypothetical protein n=1 Tax=Dechloromonas denitrificans TaxID=281362 RepID=UPI001CF9165F|nr:hypothetical protein [Dechloromonas denitrificans]UCV02333.1 hypothetical protein KI611_14705 [Dechloromonas denitrificans]